jgi:hypothetical protein
MLAAIAATLVFSTSPQTAPSAEVWIAQADRQGSTVRITITNPHDRTLCYQLGHGARSLRVSRNGRVIPSAPGLPFVSVRDRCKTIEPGATLTEEYDLDLAYPGLRRDDRLCFTARLWFKDDAELTTPVTACRLLD